MVHEIVEKKITLEFYHPKYKTYLKDYYLTEDQIRFTSYPLAAIEKCEKETERHPVVILYNGFPAGFFVLHEWAGVKAYSDNKKAILLRAYSVDSNFQGKGIATESLRLLPTFVKEHFPDKNEIILAVNARNKIAQHVYKKGAFIDHGKRTMGKKGELHIYDLAL